MAKYCSFCGNKLGILSQQITFKDGVMCGKCLIKYKMGYKNGFAPGAQHYGETHTIGDFNNLISEGKDYSDVQVQSATEEWENSKDGQKFRNWLAKKGLSDINKDNFWQLEHFYEVFKDLDATNAIDAFVGSDSQINKNQMFLLTELAQQNWLLIKQNDQLQKQNEQIIELLKNK